MAQWSDFIGTVKGYIRLGLTGVRLKNSSGTLAVRNAGDTAAAPISTSGITGMTTALSAAQGGTGLTSPGTSGNVLTSNGADWVSSAAAGGISITWSIKTTTYTAVAGDCLQCNTTSAAFTVTLPASPAANDVVRIADYAGTFATNNLTIARNALNIMGLSENMVLDISHVSITLTYIDATRGWNLT